VPFRGWICPVLDDALGRDRCGWAEMPGVIGPRFDFGHELLLEPNSKNCDDIFQKIDPLWRGYTTRWVSRSIPLPPLKFSVFVANWGAVRLQSSPW